jgi:hypothetical protein
MTSLTALLSRWPLIRQIRGRADGTGMEAMSDKTRAMHAWTDDAQVARGTAFDDWLNKYAPQDGPPNLHPEQPPPGAPCARAGGGHGLEGKIDTR